MVCASSVPTVTRSVSGILKSGALHPSWWIRTQGFFLRTQDFFFQDLHRLLQGHNVCGFIAAWCPDCNCLFSHFFWLRGSWSIRAWL